MTLKEYIESLGSDGPSAMAEFAKRHKISLRSTAHYRWGTRQPRPEIARRLVAESPLTWDDIYPKESA